MCTLYNSPRERRFRVLSAQTTTDESFEVCASLGGTKAPLATASGILIQRRNKKGDFNLFSFYAEPHAFVAALSTSSGSGCAPGNASAQAYAMSLPLKTNVPPNRRTPSGGPVSFSFGSIGDNAITLVMYFHQSCKLNPGGFISGLVFLSTSVKLPNPTALYASNVFELSAKTRSFGKFGFNSRNF